MSIIMKMIYVCKSDPSIRFYDEVSLKTFIETNPSDRRYTFWETVYEAFDDTAGTDIHTNLNVAYTPKEVSIVSQKSVDRTNSSNTSALDSYIRYTGLSDGVETVPVATGSGRTITFKNSSDFKWTLTAPALNSIDGETNFVLFKKCSISIVDSAINLWDII